MSESYTRALDLSFVVDELLPIAHELRLFKVITDYTLDLRFIAFNLIFVSDDIEMV